MHKLLLMDCQAARVHVLACNGVRLVLEEQVAKTKKRAPAVIGVSDHGGWAVLMTVARGGTLLDRRRVELVEAGLPAMPHHHEGQKLPLPEAVALVERVRASAERCAHARLAELASAVEVDGQAIEIVGIALREAQSLPATVAERLTDYRAMCVADWVMYRQALADAATARGWSVHRYDAKQVFDDAARVLERDSIDALLEETRAAFGRPWQKDHRMAMAAAIAAGS